VIKYKQIVKWQTEEVLSKIHINFRVSYLRDYIMPRFLDELTQFTLAQVLQKNMSAVLNQLYTDGDALDQIIEQLKSKDMGTLDFILEVFRQVRYSVGMTHENREKIITSLVSRNLFDVLMPLIDCPINIRDTK